MEQSRIWPGTMDNNIGQTFRYQITLLMKIQNKLRGSRVQQIRNAPPPPSRTKHSEHINPDPHGPRRTESAPTKHGEHMNSDPDPHYHTSGRILPLLFTRYRSLRLTVVDVRTQWGGGREPV